MSSIAQILGFQTEPHPLRDAFLKWQCRVRMIAMRENMGRPDDTITPSLTLKGSDEPMGHIITVMSKLPQFSKTPELQHLVKQTFDPAKRREKALELFSSIYYQKGREFSDILTSSFPAGSKGAEAIRAAEYCTIRFEAYNQIYELECKVWTLAKNNALYQATWWHNHLFNPDMSDDAVILGFEPDWDASRADPSPV
jgi:hypothetical protein